VTSPHRPDPKQRGRRVVVWMLGLFFGIQLLSTWLLDRHGLRIRFPVMAEVKAEVLAEKPQIVFLGSSRFGSTVNPELMTALFRRELGDKAPRVANAAVAAGDPIVSERMLDQLLAQGCRPRLVVVEMLPESVNWWDVWLEQQVLRLLDWRDMPDVVPSLRHMNFLRVFRARFLPLYTHRYHLRKEARLWAEGLFAEPAPAAAEPPLAGIPEVDPPLPELTPEKADELASSSRVGKREVRDYHVGGMVRQRLERLLARCQKEQIHVLLLGEPVCSAHRNDYTPEIEAAFRSYLDELERRYGCTFLDRRDALPDAAFRDYHHAIQDASCPFSRRLVEQDLLPLWKRIAQP
jgi:hypothetical protein